MDWRWWIAMALAKRMINTSVVGGIVGGLKENTSIAIHS
jgi:hypothetical protein